MTTTFTVFWNAKPDVASELAFLKQLKADLARAGVSATLLANYFTRSGSRQVDFLVITEKHVCHVELKNYPGLLHGTQNGPWSVVKADGTTEVMADRQNPYSQAFACKMAISDDMQALAAQQPDAPQPPPGRQFYSQIDSVVCVFPRLADGSEVPDDYKVRTLGYNEFVEFLLTPGHHPAWSADNWASFIRMLGLISAAERRQSTLSQNAATALVRNYSEQFKSLYGRDLHELVPLPLTVGTEAISVGELADRLPEAKNIQVIGRPGCGKTHMVKHILLGLPDGPLVPVFIEGTMYEGRLSALLDRSVAPLTTGSAADLLRSAAINGQTILLVIDSFNECPQSLKDRLLGDLSALCRRAKIVTLLTSQTTVGVPAPLSGQVVYIDDLADADRLAVLSSYGAPEILELVELFSTAYELSIAAECAGEIGDSVTRALLFAAFIRKRLRKTRSPAMTRQVLRRLALAMDERLTAWLPLDEAWRLAEDYLSHRSEPVSVVDDVLQCSITRTDQGRFAFNHELLGRFLVLEALRQTHHSPSALTRQLRLPRHDDLSRMAVELESTTSRAAELLAGLADRTLYFWALRGELGQAAEQAARAAAKRLLDEITASMTEVVFTIPDNVTLTVAGGRELSYADRALLASIGLCVRGGEFVRQVLSLLDATDEACHGSADAQEAQTRLRPSASDIVSAVLTGFTETARVQVAVAIILDGCENGDLDSRLWSRGYRTFPVSLEGLTLALEGARPTSYGRLLLLARCLRRADGLDAAALSLRVLPLCWASGVYHIRLEALWMIQGFARTVQGHALHDEIVSVLDELDAGDFMLNSSLGETWDAYGMLETPDEASEIRTRIEQILDWPQTDDACRLAYGIASSQFEGVATAQYLEAVESLRPEQRTILHTRAALGSDTIGAWNDLILRRLLAYDDPQALPAFERWATELDTRNIVVHEVTDCFILGVLGCAKFMDQPPRLVHNENSERAAWECYGAIIFWMHRPGLKPDEVTNHCEEYWQRLQTELLPAAADPLYWLRHTSIVRPDETVSVVGAILTTFGEDARPILDWSLEQQEALLSVFPAVRTAGPEHQDFVISMLGVVGDAETAEKLRAYVDHPYLGSSAITAIKRLAGRSFDESR
jgi:hypothetical protein